MVTSASALSQAAARIMDQFERGWSAPSPTAFDVFLADDVVLVQPGLPTARGRTQAHESLARLFLFAPTLTGRVVSWSSDGDVLFIEIEFSAPGGRRPLRFNAVDRVLFDAHGVVHERITYMDPLVLAKQIARSPRLMLRWVWSRLVRDPVAKADRLNGR